MLLQLFVAHNGGKRLRKGTGDLVIDPCMGLGVVSRRQDQEKQDQPQALPLQDPSVEAGEIREQVPVFKAVDQRICSQDKAGQHKDDADQAEDDALRHDDAHVLSHAETHGTERQEAGDGGRGTAGKRSEGGGHRRCHGILDIFVPVLFLLVPVVQKDRVVHCDAELQDGGDGAGDVGDLSQENVGPHVVGDGYADTGEEQEGHHRRFKADEQHCQRQHDCDHGVDRKL